MSDEDLIFLIKSGSKLAEKVFYVRYSSHAHYIAKTYHIEFNDSGITEEEFYEVIFSKTHEALLNYVDIERSFYKYWKAVTKNAVYDYVRMNSYHLGAKALSGISFDETRFIDNERMVFHDIIGEKDDKDISPIEILEKYIYGEETYLSKEEKLVAHLLYFKEYTTQEIIDYLHLKRSRVNYLIRTTRSKIQQILKENYL